MADLVLQINAKAAEALNEIGKLDQEAGLARLHGLTAAGVSRLQARTEEIRRRLARLAGLMVLADNGLEDCLVVTTPPPLQALPAKRPAVRLG